MSTQTNEQTSLASHKETPVLDINRKQRPNNEEQQVKAVCKHIPTTTAIMPNIQNKGCRVNEASATTTHYGAVNTVCQSCHHLYAGNPEVVLSPAFLKGHSARHDHATLSPASTHRPWAPAKYDGLCECEASVSGSECICQERAQHWVFNPLFSCSSLCSKRAKVAALVLAAILPWVFLVTYIVLTTI